jgi:hypothetical protein
MYASPVSLLGLPPPRRRVNQGKFAPAERGRPPELLLRSGTRLLVRSCGAWTPARAAPAESGRPEATVWRILRALKERVIP